MYMYIHVRIHVHVYVHVNGASKSGSYYNMIITFIIILDISHRSEGQSEGSEEPQPQYVRGTDNVVPWTQWSRKDDNNVRHSYYCDISLTLHAL